LFPSLFVLVYVWYSFLLWADNTGYRLVIALLAREKFTRSPKVVNFATIEPLSYCASARQEFLGLPRSLRFLPDAKHRKEFVDKLFERDQCLMRSRE
jgi:hypothetical protein